MPYKKTFRKKRYPRRKKSSGVWGKWGVMGKSTVGIAKQALKTAKWIKSIVNTEYKHYDYNVATPAVITYNGTITTTLCGPSQGTSASDRTGDSIKMKNLIIRGQWAMNGTQQEIVRMIIFIDKQNTITTGSQLLEVVGSANAVYSPKKNNNMYDTKFIYDKTFIIDNDNPIRKFDQVWKIDLHEHFDAGTATVDTNALKLALFTQQAVNGSTFQYYSRVTYVDN